MSWVVDNVGLIVGLTGEHLRQSAPPILWGLLIALPLGWLAHRSRVLRGPVIVATGLLYTLPSLALLPILPVVFGFSALSEINLVVALTIYAVAILVRSVADGLDSVDADTRRSAVALGYGPVRRFLAVELPLAGPVILAGLRVTAVSTISLATVGVLIGVTNLGYLFTNGFQRRIVPEILAGVVAVAVVALVVDLLLQLAGRLLMPWTRTIAPRRAAVRQGAEA
ncbi:ABC transporter permease subunit [Microbacterium betulae]|uniref:ABC transporter permease subunit n=1 Tax=Microbacterium betulae TaxID=2981139 RepID=A0AA97FMV8_9MICO|nr:ABC transporter permease subunit [Microbacterium sp. AB]WOF24322.1 ABC transporter permease subunit [Microbacterium sp. AB]